MTHPDDVPVADAAEQDRPVEPGPADDPETAAGTDPDVPADADPADVADQRTVAETDDADDDAADDDGR